ncbi:MAG: glycosyltransferase family 4 protein [Phycisphaerales bacterium]
MRVLFINQVFYPDHAATAQHAHDLARHLIAHGHEVQVIASRSIYGEKGAGLPARETVDGAQVYRVGRSLFGKAGLLARAADFALFYLMATIKAFTIPKADVVVCFTTPPFIALLGWLLRVFRGSRFVYWVMDLYPDLPVACGVMRERALATRLFERLNRFCLRRADRVVVLGRCMHERVMGKGVADDDPTRIAHIGVWSDPAEVKPIDRSTNPYREEWSLGDRFVIMYSGNFGLGHDVRTMCDAAALLSDDDRFRFVFAGGGKRKDEVERFVRERSLTNAVLAPYQPRERLDQSLSVADVHLASLRKGVEGIMVPCKLFGIMAAERPTIFIGDPSSELARVLAEHECGVTVNPGDAAQLVAAIRRLAGDPTLAARLGGNARRALSSAYDRSAACHRWLELLEQVAGAPHRTNTRPAQPPSQPAPTEEVSA